MSAPRQARRTRVGTVGDGGATSRRITSALAALGSFERRTRPVDPESAAAVRRRWDELPEHVKHEAQLLGRFTTGCEGTHGVFPSCNFSCKPCYHSADANRVRVDGEHTVRQVAGQMAFLRGQRGPAAHAQLIGGEVSLLAPDDHAAALETMRAHGRRPMSMSHGDFDEAYLHALVLRSDGTRRLEQVSFAAHIDSTMWGRTGMPKPVDEAALDGHRAHFCMMFARLRRDHGVRSYLAHNMTVTPSNLAEVARTISACRHQGWRMFSFQPAAYVGNSARWQAGYRAMTDDDVWAEIERGAGRRLPYRALQFGDVRCNRVCWGVFVGERYVPILEDDDPRDLMARDHWLRILPGGMLAEPNPWINVVRLARRLVREPRLLHVAAAWATRFVHRAGGPRALRRGVRPVTFAMHSFMDAAVVDPAWRALRRGELVDDPAVRAAQERLQACVYAMAHPETGEIVPACVQHAVLDPAENAQLVLLLPRRDARHDDGGPAAT